MGAREDVRSFIGKSDQPTDCRSPCPPTHPPAVPAPCPACPPPPPLPPLLAQISPAEEGLLRAKLVEAILGPEAAERSGGGGGRQWLPGSQPVSLDASNQGLLGERQYWVTWKADGTRYMLLLLRWGTYLVDRKFTIRRVQMRWPTALPPGAKANAPTGPPHHWVSAAAGAAGRRIKRRCPRT